jgi:low temperature requirement protein LtrA
VTATTDPAGASTGPETADPVELFFDLAFVFAAARLVGFLHHELTATSVAQALVLLSLLWWAWSQFTWSANAVGNGGRGIRAVFLLATVATVPIGASIDHAFDATGAVFATSWAVLLLAGSAVYVIGVWHDEAQRRAVVCYELRTLPGALLVLVGAAVTDPTGRLVLWALGFLGLVVAAALVGGDGFEGLVASHFAERYGLIVIVALGETVVALGIGVAESLGESLDAGTLGVLVSGGALACLLWWSYFDRIAPTAEHHLATADGAVKGRMARDLYTYLHLPIFAGIVLVAVALEEIVVHPADPLDVAMRGVLAAGLGLFLGGFVLADLRASRTLERERTVALLLLVVGVLAAPLSGLGLLVAVDVALLLALVVEDRLSPAHHHAPAAA